MESLILRGGRVLLNGRIVDNTNVTLADGCFVEARPATDVWDVSGLLLLPGIVDLHGDSFERQIMPRPGVRFPLDMALFETDRQMIANGITTAYHGLTFSWEPGLRGRETAYALIDALAEVRPRLACDTRLHLRHEVYNIDGIDEIGAWIAAGHIDLLAFNDHLPLFAAKVGRPSSLIPPAERAGISVDRFIGLIEEVRLRAPQVAEANRLLATRAKAHAIPMLSHDDENPDMRRRYHELGARLCEFPVDAETAAASLAMEDPVILGAPNVLRGGSHCDRLGAAEAVRAGLCSILTSDYYYPSNLYAPFWLAARDVLPLAKAWELVSGGPARAVRLDDRGRIAPGKRADLIVVDDSDRLRPRVVATFVNGTCVFQAQDLEAAAALRKTA